MEKYYLCTASPLAKVTIMAETIVVTMLIIAIAVALLSVKVIVKKNGSFSSQHIDDSEAMRRRGIRCVLEQDREARNRKSNNQQRINNNQ